MRPGAERGATSAAGAGRAVCAAGRAAATGAPAARRAAPRRTRHHCTSAHAGNTQLVTLVILF